MKKMKIAVIGATGLVGRAFLNILENQMPEIDQSNLVLVASNRRHQAVHYLGASCDVMSIDDFILNFSLMKIDIAFVTIGEKSKEITPKLLRKKIWVIDNSPVFRNDKNLGLPWINHWQPKEDQKLLPVANCVAAMLATTIYPILKLKPLQIAATCLQSVSGAGQIGLDTLEFENLENMPHPDSPFPFMAANSIQSATYAHKKEKQFNKEEYKIIHELPALVGETLDLNIRSFRVPVECGHFADIVVEFPVEVTKRKLINVLNSAPEIVFSKEQVSSREVVHKNHCLVWNLSTRYTLSRHFFSFSVASDNLYHGAAYPAAMMIKKIIEKFYD